MTEISIINERDHKYPREFLDNLYINAWQTLDDWLENNQAPKKVREMVEELLLFKELLSGVCYDMDRIDFEIQEAVPRLTNYIVDLDGAFYSRGMISGSENHDYTKDR